jgi:hypothetical protein
MIYKNTLHRFLEVFIHPTEDLRQMCRGDSGFEVIGESEANLSRSEQLRVNQLNKILHVSLVLGEDDAISLKSDDFLHYHTMVRKLFPTYERALQAVEKFRQEHTRTRVDSKLSPTDLSDLQSAIKTLQKSSDVMNALAFRSPSFQRYLTSKAIGHVLYSLNEDQSVNDNIVSVISRSSN